MGLKRVELLTPSLSEKCSNQLSYSPVLTIYKKKKKKRKTQINFFSSVYIYTILPFLLERR